MNGLKSKEQSNQRKAKMTEQRKEQMMMEQNFVNNAIFLTFNDLEAIAEL